MVRACWRGRGRTEAGESSRRWRTGIRGWCAPVGGAVAALRLEKVPGGRGQASEGGARLLAGPWQDLGWRKFPEVEDKHQRVVLACRLGRGRTEAGESPQR